MICYSPMHMLMGWHLNVYHLPIHSLIHLLSIYFSICRSLFLHSNWGMPHLHQAPEWPKKSHFVLLWSMWLDKNPFVWESFATRFTPSTYDILWPPIPSHFGRVQIVYSMDWTQTSEKNRLCMAMLYAYQTRSEISWNFWFLGHTRWKQLPTLNRWPPSLSRSIQPYSFFGAQPNVASKRMRVPPRPVEMRNLSVVAMRSGASKENRSKQQTRRLCKTLPPFLQEINCLTCLLCLLLLAYVRVPPWPCLPAIVRYPVHIWSCQISLRELFIFRINATDSLIYSRY